MTNVSKAGNTKSFSKTQFMVYHGVNKNYIVLFSQDFKNKVQSFNLYIIDSYIKRTLGRWIPRIEQLLTCFIDRIISSFL